MASLLIYNVVQANLFSTHGERYSTFICQCHSPVQKSQCLLTVHISIPQIHTSEGQKDDSVKCMKKKLALLFIFVLNVTQGYNALYNKRIVSRKTSFYIKMCLKHTVHFKNVFTKTIVYHLKY